MKRRGRLLVPFLITLLLIGSLAYGGWYWYDNNVDRSGWVEKEGVVIYQDFYGDPVSGWLDIGGQRYFFAPDGTPKTRWQEIDGNTYYFHPDGTMATGWQDIDGERYYFVGTGEVIDGWLYLDTGRYYLTDGKPAKGWQEIDGERYYFTEEGVTVHGFTEVDGSVYCFTEEGVMLTGKQTLDEQIYSFGEDGVMHTGWEETEEGRRYYYPDGPMALDWTIVDEKLYYFQEDGLMYTGWLTQGEYRYYLHSEGHAAVGPTQIDGHTYHFTPQGIEVVLVNALNPVPDYYEMELKKVVDYHKVDVRCYDALMKMLEDCKAAGNKYTFNSAYRSIAQQTEILELRTAEHMQEFDLGYQDAREKALQTVAVPGTSEHHLGLAVDLLGADAIAWLTENCWDYGFIVRYRGDQYDWTGIIEEPWHFRYVGVEVAQDIRASGLSLEEYLGAEQVKPGAVWEPEEETE